MNNLKVMKAFYIPNTIDDKNDAEKSITIKFKSVIIIISRLLGETFVFGDCNLVVFSLRKYNFEIDTRKMYNVLQIMFLRPLPNVSHKSI